MVVEVVYGMVITVANYPTDIKAHEPVLNNGMQKTTIEITPTMTTTMTMPNINPFDKQHHRYHPTARRPITFTSSNNSNPHRLPFCLPYLVHSLVVGNGASIRIRRFSLRCRHRPYGAQLSSSRKVQRPLPVQKAHHRPPEWISGRRERYATRVAALATSAVR